MKLVVFVRAWARMLALGWSQLASPHGRKSVTLAVYLFGFAFAALLIAVLSTQGKPFFSALLALATTRMVLSGVFEAWGSTEWYRISGGFGIALAALAMYGGVALGMEDAKQREVLPLFRRGAAAASFEGLDRQLEAEPGVRQQL